MKIIKQGSLLAFLIFSATFFSCEDHLNEELGLDKLNGATGRDFYSEQRIIEENEVPIMVRLVDEQKNSWFLGVISYLSKYLIYSTPTPFLLLRLCSNRKGF